ncbi:site-specific DNA-methyltransferase, partial [Lactobacillus delbrueckii subsp. lactis]|nr:site-specific DNA-methyltransferase [Lactobacillus delbrueckii subsp. lactis]
MDKLKMHTPDIAEQNYKKLAALFPDAITETTDEDGNIIRAIDKDVLMQEINTKVIDDGQERYQFTWPDKRKSMVMANTPISKTLRLEKEKSVGRDGTPGGVDSENIYIEGDNLDALKLLQETYLGKVKMIYIDPPYNTGNDFIYEDDFAQSSDEYADNSGQTDEEGNRLVQNSESNGRFHTDWLNMIYPRLRLARDFLTDDGVIFISIDENEVQNLRKVCDEIFGEANFVSQLGWQKVYSPKNQAKYFSNDYEYVLCYAKKIENFKLNDLPRTEEMNARYKNPDNDPRGDWKPGDCIGNGERKNGNYTVISPITGKAFTVPQGKHWVYAPKKMEQLIKDNRIYFGKDGNSIPSVKQFLSEMGGRKASSLLMYDDYGHTDMAKKDLKKLFPELEKIPFPTPKPVKLVKTLAKLGTNKGDVIMDFFAGSATSAQSILDLNSEMHMHRKFILVQSGEEKIEKNQKAELLGIKTISDLAQVRIRRAGKKIKEETAADIDYGFRFFKVDSSNMKDVYHAPADVEQLSLDCFEDNIKEDRTPEDDMTPEIRTLISGVIFMTKYTKEIKLAIYHEWVDDHRRGTYLS